MHCASQNASLSVRGARELLRVSVCSRLSCSQNNDQWSQKSQYLIPLLWSQGKEAEAGGRGGVSFPPPSCANGSVHPKMHLKALKDLSYSSVVTNQ